MTRHPATATGAKTQVGQTAVGWRMYCDREGCATSSDTRPSQTHLPLLEFHEAGWHVAKGWGDRCPQCVAAGHVVPIGQRWAPRGAVEAVPS